jgi:hypothetical protein
MKYNILLSLLLVVLLTGCRDDDPNTIPTALIYTYYPVNVGHELVYDVTLITKDEFTGVHDTDIYQMKEVIESIFMDNQNRPTQRLERYRRDTPNDPWVISDVWTSNLTSNHLERKEENVTYVRLAFPILNSLTWNGNVYNTLEPRTYSYEDLHIPMALNGMTFDSTLKVLQIDEDNFIEREYARETFANHVGLIDKEEIYILKDYTIPNQPGIKAQRLYRQKLIAYANRYSL